jgi:hypothetical protein
LVPGRPEEWAVEPRQQMQVFGVSPSAEASAIEDQGLAAPGRIS